MNKHISDVDSEARARRWLGGEASVPRYPQRRQSPFTLNGSLISLVALSVGLGLVGGILIGLQCRRRPDASRQRP
ncbi:MAG: hypothetical protein H0X01_04070 [Nitrospira sp.]|nr:hypothetical protein [Nitrospira sp.]